MSWLRSSSIPWVRSNLPCEVHAADPSGVVKHECHPFVTSQHLCSVSSEHPSLRSPYCQPARNCMHCLNRCWHFLTSQLLYPMSSHQPSLRSPCFRPTRSCLTWVSSIHDCAALLSREPRTSFLMKSMLSAHEDLLKRIVIHSWLRSTFYSSTRSNLSLWNPCCRPMRSC